MNLHEYLNSVGALTVAQLRERINAKSDAQIRQWQHGYADRKPGTENAVLIELHTDGKVAVESWGFEQPWSRIPDPNWPHPDGRPVVDPAKADA